MIYKKIVASLYGKDMASAAWQNLVSKYPEAKNTTVGVVNALKRALNMAINTDGRFIAYNNGTVLDTQTNLIWAAEDNGSDINWENAKSYCENYREGGYTNWRMPTQGELAGLYDADKTYKSNWGYNVHLTEVIRLSCDWAWASETRGSEAAGFGFGGGDRGWSLQSGGLGYRALPVRSGK